MRAPQFWQHDGMLARSLAPLSAVTAAITARRMTRAAYDCGVAVVCVGNASVGGSGKTVLARHILARYRARGAAPYALTRGHGGRLRGPVLVDPAIHGAREVGDEALLLAASAPTIVASDRAAGARLAVASGASVIVMDDGLQNSGLRKTVSLLTIDGGAGFGNFRTLPAGPLREPVAAAAARCAAGVLIGADRHGALASLPGALPVLTARLIASSPVELAGKRVVGFAGIGRPEKFFASLRGLGAELAGTRSFPDHYRYTPRDEARLSAMADQARAILATTEKDAVKLSATFTLRCAIIGVDLGFEDAVALDRLLP
ncbi:MAG: tetraacyldisaccharide 4'-kinase [Acidiphilium sp.]|nr:tetraacyldisaccharide 4'-kinase [Acidiphilium sp.]MDD4934669.1 tetraacyldisaccharide 4'-kinase [Acidiphilium sp.]